ncbi:hypothetical protein LTR53_002158 [Teratosphaeriaceae sp. CCFEE 6253]|nr:hypothetical protein LTR53_002158 [Teratosphaeriaceae sp. CCFEE 6253]
MADTLIIAIDFGTTFSGVAAAYSGNPEAPDELNTIKTWPGGSGTTSDKVPSEVAYSHHTASALHHSQPLQSKRKFDVFNEELDKSPLSAFGGPSNEGQMRWGYQIKPDEDRLRYLKLFLDPSQPIPDYATLPDMRYQLMACGKNVGTIIAEYLRALFAHTKITLARRYSQQFVDNTKLTLVLTVPAVWSDAAKDATFKAAEAAGIGDNLAMISEPEAAAIYTLQALQVKHLSIGHNFVVVDAGGGTVDLISYGIRRTTPLRLEELAKGSGAFCGGAFLNIGFERFVREKLGKTAFASICATKGKSWLMALKYFEDHVKRNFDADDDTGFNIPFPGVEDNVKTGMEDGFLAMTTADVGTIFRPIITNIISLIEAQVAELKKSGLKVNGLLLVGGLGQSEYLHKCLQARFGPVEGGMEVLQPVNAWTAVVRGAVLWGLSGADMVMSRKARRYYGVRIRERFDPLRHPAGSKLWDTLEEVWTVEDQMKWYIMKGQTVSSTKPVRFPFYRTCRDTSSRVVTSRLYICDSDLAPKAYNATSTPAACSTTVDLTSVPAHLWVNRYNSKGVGYQTLSFEMGMQIESGGLRFDFVVNDVVYGKATATFK